MIDNKIYESWFGKIYPISDTLDKTNNKIEPVFSEKLAYTRKEDYKEGVKLTVEDNYLVPILESGIVVYKGDKDNYGYTIIIEQVNGIDLWYVGLEKSDLKVIAQGKKVYFFPPPIDKGAAVERIRKIIDSFFNFTFF